MNPLEHVAAGFKRAAKIASVEKRKGYRRTFDLCLGAASDEVINSQLADARKAAVRAIGEDRAAEARELRAREDDATRVKRRRWGHDQAVMGQARGVNLGVEGNQVEVSATVARPDSTAHTAFKPKGKRAGKNWRAKRRG